MGSQRRGLVRPAAEERGALSLEQRERAVGFRRRFGEQRRAGDERAEQAAGEPARPEERHRDVQAVVGADPPRLESRRDGAQRAAVRVDRSLRRAAAPRGEQHDEVVGRPHARLEGAHECVIDRRLGQVVGEPHVAQARKARMAATRSSHLHDAWCYRLEVVEVGTAAELAHQNEVQ